MNENNKNEGSSKQKASAKNDHTKEGSWLIKIVSRSHLITIKMVVRHFSVT
jgi:hypothetical protein